jgi:predicted nucleic acid-binding protein
LEVALAAQAAGLVTGNKVNFPADLCQGLPVFSPREFLAFNKKKSGRPLTKNCL